METFLQLLGIFLPMIVVLLLGVPVPLAMLMVGVFALTAFLPIGHLSAIGSITWSTASNPILVAVPLFLLMGELFARSNVSEPTYAALSKLTDRLPGGLWHSNVVSCGLFAAASGSSIGTAAAMGSVAMPALNARKYPRAISYGSLAAGGTLGILIPPSLGMIIYGVLTGTSIGKLFIAGIIPGLLLVGSFSAYIAFWSIRHKDQMPERLNPTLPETLRGLLSLLPLLTLILVVIGSIYFGIATPTESAAMGVGGMVVLLAVFRSFSVVVVREAMIRTVEITSMIFLILVGAKIITYVVSYLGIATNIAEGLASANMPSLVLIFVLILVYLGLGMLLDPLSVMALTLPIVFPAIVAAGLDPVWFGVFIIINIELGLITPPVGLNLFIIRGIDPTGKWNEVIFGAIPFGVAMLIVLVLLALAPGIVTWLPGLIS